MMTMGRAGKGRRREGKEKRANILGNNNISLSLSLSLSLAVSFEPSSLAAGRGVRRELFKRETETESKL